MRLAVGCPIFEREWCFDRWVDSVECQEWPDGTELEFHFVYTPGGDDTLGVIRHRLLTANVTVIEDKRPGFRNEQRADSDRYRLLAELRNKLLDSVRASKPDYFLSWDSDMIFGPVLHHLFIEKPVVGALVDMLGFDWMLDIDGGEPAFPSWMWLEGDQGVRGRRSYAASGPFRVGVVMGTLLMSRLAFNSADYEFHPQGEDIGFAIQCRRFGVEQWLAPAARGVHLHAGPGDKDDGGRG